MPKVERELTDEQQAIFMSKVERARRASISEKLADGPLLFDQNMRLMRDFIGAEHPDFSEQQIDAEVDRRLQIAKQLSSRGIYRDAGTIDE